MTSPLLAEFLGTMVLILLGRWSCRRGAAEALKSGRRRVDRDCLRVGVCR